jgi:hypothetical protein
VGPAVAQLASRPPPSVRIAESTRNWRRVLGTALRRGSVNVDNPLPRFTPDQNATAPPVVELHHPDDSIRPLFVAVKGGWICASRASPFPAITSRYQRKLAFGVLRRVA